MRQDEAEVPLPALKVIFMADTRDFTTDIYPLVGLIPNFLIPQMETWGKSHERRIYSLGVIFQPESRE